VQWLAFVHFGSVQPDLAQEDFEVAALEHLPWHTHPALCLWAFGGVVLVPSLAKADEALRKRPIVNRRANLRMIF
jgi:hypothetical protein